jgi:acid phosphatase family membrane protein YuiD
LAGLSLALLLGAFGFVFQPFWIGAIVVMAVLWGSAVSSRRHSGEGAGVVAELVAAAVREGHDVSDAISSR